jgi:hypothetical protein
MSAINIELPEAVHQKAKELAREKAMPLERLMVVALIEKLAVMFPDEKLEQRAPRGSDAGFDEFMNGVPDVEPEDYDRLPPK